MDTPYAYVATPLDSNFSVSNVLARGIQSAISVNQSVRHVSNWTVVSPKVDLVIYVVN